MQTVLKEEKAAEETRTHARKVRWGVYCITPWQDDLTHVDAIDELSVAAAECDCGGKHIVLTSNKR